MTTIADIGDGNKCLFLLFFFSLLLLDFLVCAVFENINVGIFFSFLSFLLALCNNNTTHTESTGLLCQGQLN